MLGVKQKACTGFYFSFLFQFSQNKNLLSTILETHPRTLVEASPFDKVWGIGLEANDPRASNRKYWKGQNLLGQALTEVREKLRRKKKKSKDKKTRKRLFQSQT